MFIVVSDYILTRFSPLPSQDFYCSLSRDQSRDVTPRLGIFVILQLTSFRVWIVIPATIITTTVCSNRCAEALAVKMKFYTESHLLRLMRLNS